MNGENLPLVTPRCVKCIYYNLWFLQLSFRRAGKLRDRTKLPISKTMTTPPSPGDWDRGPNSITTTLHRDLTIRTYYSSVADLFRLDINSYQGNSLYDSCTRPGILSVTFLIRSSYSLTFCLHIKAMFNVPFYILSQTNNF